MREQVTNEFVSWDVSTYRRRIIEYFISLYVQYEYLHDKEIIFDYVQVINWFSLDVRNY